MTHDECINGWIEQYDELLVYLDKISYKNFDCEEIIKLLSEKYSIVDVYGNGRRAHIQLLKNGHKMVVSVKINKDNSIDLMNTAECWFASNDRRKCSVSGLREDYYKSIALENGGCFKTGSYTYMIDIYNTENDKCQTHYRRNKDDAYQFAREQQQHLSTLRQCYFIVIHKCEIEDWPYTITPIPNSRYIISTKTKKETKFEMRKKLKFDFFADEYFYDRQVKYEHDTKIEEDVMIIVVMSVVKLDSEGNLETDMQLYSTKDEAREKSNEIIEDWMRKNGFTFDEDKLNDKYSHLKLCEKRDFGNSIKINCVQSIAELNISILEIEV